MITAQTLIARADQIDSRLGPIAGRDADTIARELREAARLISAAPDLAESNAASIEVMERAADHLEHAGRKDTAEQLRRQANVCRAALAKAGSQ